MELAVGSPPTLTHIVSLERRWVSIITANYKWVFMVSANFKWVSIYCSLQVGSPEPRHQLRVCGDGDSLSHYFYPLLQSQGSSEEWVGTVMGYLTSVQQGGHTVFPRCSR